jgi:hypothetical protein
LALVAGLLALAVQSGELGSADTMYRLQVAHSFWTSDPPVFPNQYPEFGVHGRGGKLYDWYGIGQPLLLLPFDVVGTGIAKLPIFADYDDSDPTVRDIFISFTVNALINILTALICFRFLASLGFDLRQSAAGVLALLFCTTHLHYTQNMMENNYILLLTLIGFTCQYQWLDQGSKRALAIGSAALGLNLLTRLTTVLDLIAAALFLLVCLYARRARRGEYWSRLVDYVRVSGPIYLIFIFCDRLYQFHRFGNWTTTYVKYFALERRLENPNLPLNYPWTTTFKAGFLGPLISPEKSIFLFDPLIVLTIVVCIAGWKRFAPEVRAFLVSVFLLILGYICLYARYYEWSGNFAWGDRYVSSAVEMAAFISVPLLLRYRTQLGKVAWSVGMFLIAASLAIQLASLAFWLPLEIYQGDDLGHPQWVIWLRFRNIVAFALGKRDAWGLTTDSMKYDPWDYQHLTCWNFLPFVLRGVGSAPRWVIDVTLALWATCLALLGYCVTVLRRSLSVASHFD